MGHFFFGALCEWKSAHVTPAHKKDNIEIANNCRPISLLPITSKILERWVCTQPYEHVPDLTNNVQHAFLRGLSCVTQLLSTLHQIRNKLDQNIQTVVHFLDFAKAFDSVDNDILLENLKGYGITGNPHNWFTDYLRNRLQRAVVVEGAGSALDPMLFPTLH